MGWGPELLEKKKSKKQKNRNFATAMNKEISTGTIKAQVSEKKTKPSPRVVGRFYQWPREGILL